MNQGGGAGSESPGVAQPDHAHRVAVCGLQRDRSRQVRGGIASVPSRHVAGHHRIDLGRSPRDVDTYFYAAVASVADRRSNSTGQIWPRLECLLLVL